MIALRKLCYLIATMTFALPAIAQTQPAATESGQASFSGRAVDAQTGKAVNDFATQWGVVDKDGVIKWGYSESTSSNRRNGAFSESSGWQVGTKVSVRVIASGYLAQPVVDEPLSVPTAMSGLVVRLKRGETLHGTVVDHTGKPADQAKVFLAGAQPLRINDGVAENFKGSSATTDVSGEFELKGFDPNGDQRIVAIANGLSTVLVNPSSDKPLTVQFPEPAKLQISYDIANDEAEAKLHIELKTWEVPEWKNCNVTQSPTVAQKNNIEIQLSPGVYDFGRWKNVRLGDMGRGVIADRRSVTLKAGESQSIDLTRPHGRSIGGEVTGMKDADVEHAMITIRSADATGDPRAMDEWKLPIFDVVACTQDDPHFKTAALEPGTYTLVVEAWRRESREQGFRSGIRLPAFTATRKVTVLPDQDPDAVTLELKPSETK